MTTMDQYLMQIGCDLTAADVLPDDELESYVRQGGKASDIAGKGAEIDLGDPPWL